MATLQKPIHLAEFVKLTPTTLLYTPSNHLPTSPTILLHTWMNAAPSNIQFYFHKWRSLLPTARIILTLGTVPDMVYVPTKSQKRNLDSMLSLLRAEPESPLYAHLFSNAGSHSASVLLRAFKETSADGATFLPLKGIIFDSTPSQGSYANAYTGISYEVGRSPFYFRYPAILAIHAMLYVVVIRQAFFGTPNVITQLERDLNDEGLVTRDIPRLYIYSKEDKLVRWDDIEHHAAIAKRKGWPVRLERFPGTDHCRHGKGAGEERYWNACKEIVNNGQT